MRALIVYVQSNPENKDMTFHMRSCFGNNRQIYSQLTPFVGKLANIMIAKSPAI